MNKTGKSQEELKIHHKDGNRLNNRASNLEWITTSELRKKKCHEVSLNLNPQPIPNLQNNQIKEN